MHRVFLSFLASGFTLFGAASSAAASQPIVDIELRNDSANYLTWVSLRWDKGEQKAGILSPGVSAVLLDVGLPKHPKSDTAFLEFVDANDGWKYDEKAPNAQRKRYSIPVDVSALKRLAGGHYHVTFSILSFTEAKLMIEKKDRPR